MKRIFALLLTFGLLCYLSGCGTPEPETVPTALDPTAATVPSTIPNFPVSEDSLTEYTLPLTAVSMPPMEEVFTSTDGTVLLRYTYQDLQLAFKNPLTAESIEMDFLNLLDPMGSVCNELLQDAKQEYKTADNWAAYVFKIQYTPMRLDNGILSMYGSQILSGSTGNTSATGLSLTYNLLTGQRLSLSQILKEDIATDSLMQAVLDALAPTAANGILYSDYIQTINTIFSTNTPTENWYLSENGLCFYFDPYEIAPYSAGTIVAEIPYSDLTGILKDAYFPEEAVILTGMITIEALTGTQPGLYSQFAELILDHQGEEYLIHVYGAIDNLVLEIGSWHQNGTFTPETTVFASNALCSEDALLLQLSEDMIHRIRITYRSGNKTYSLPLSSIIAYG